MPDTPERPPLDFQKAHTKLRIIAAKIRGEHGNDSDTCPICNGGDVLVVRATLNAAEAEIAQLKQDAERWRFWDRMRPTRFPRDGKGGVRLCFTCWPAPPLRGYYETVGDTLNEALDAARSASPAPEEKP